jgi:SAM-dependent methyltransferase
MSLFYKLAYMVGFTPWEKAATHRLAAQQIAALLNREQAERTAPFGSALDLGCGTGHWAIELARRGWDVTGIDLVASAIKKARERAQKAGVAVRFIQGDVTALRRAGVGPGIRFIWDFGTIHGLTQAQREAVGREVTAVATPDATMLTLAWAPGHRGPLPRGASREEIEAVFTGWNIIDEITFDSTGLPRPLRNVDPRCYRLRRTTVPK